MNNYGPENKKTILPNKRLFQNYQTEANVLICELSYTRHENVMRPPVCNAHATPPGFWNNVEWKVLIEDPFFFKNIWIFLDKKRKRKKKIFLDIFFLFFIFLKLQIRLNFSKQLLLKYWKSRIREKKNLSTDADRRTDTILERLRDLSKKNK